MKENMLPKLRVEILSNGRNVRLLEAYQVTTAKQVIDVPAGFETDFASVPRLFWHIVPPWGRYSPAAVVHDYLYYTGDFHRKTADKIFLELMKVLGVPPWKRRTMYWAVRLFGGYAWKDHRKHGEDI